MTTRKFRKGYTTGVFDMFHIGHLNILQEAARQCETLVVGITTDRLCLNHKGKLPVIPEDQRRAIVSELRCVDQTVWQDDMDKAAAVRRLNADVVFVGSDWKGSEAWNRYERELALAGCDVVYLRHTDGISSTILRERLNANIGDGD